MGQEQEVTDVAVLIATAVVCLILPWPVALLTHSYMAAGAAFLVPALIGSAVLRRRGWKPVDFR
jgi:hypothetical protein